MPFWVRHQLLVILLLVFALSLSCDSPKQDSTASQSRSLVIGVFDKPQMINPIISNFGISSLLADIIFDGLVKIDENMSARPNLAESWKVSKNGLVWTLNIRRGVTFHDGTPLTAHDVKFTIDAIGNPQYENQFSHILDSVDSVVVVDSHTIQLNLRHPFPALINYLFFGILSKRIYEGQDLRNTQQNYNPIGTGPYRVATWADDELVFESNEVYFLGRPKISTIVVRVLESQRATWAELMRGKIDFAWFMGPDTVQVIRKLQNFKIYSFIHPYYYILVLNSRKDTFKEQATRRALNFAIDKERLVRDVLGGTGFVLSSLTYPGSKFNTSEELAYPFDPAKASKLLAKSGWTDVDNDGILERNGQKFQFSVYLPREGILSDRVALFIQEQLADVGILARMIAVPLPELLERSIKKRQYDAVFWSFIAAGDPDINYLFWSSSQIEQGLNFSGYHNRTIDGLLKVGRTSINPAERMNAYQSFQREIFRDPPGIFLFWRNLYIVLPQSIKGVRMGPGAPFISIYKWYFTSEKEASR